jgi:hypothetical protein
VTLCRGRPTTATARTAYPGWYLVDMMVSSKNKKIK